MTLKERVKQAVDNDNTIRIQPTELEAHLGFPLQYMQFLGLSKSDLKKLERKGSARRGYMKVSKGKLYKGYEIQVRWVLVGGAI